MSENEKKDKTVRDIIEEVCNEICNHYCKYPDIWDAEKDGELIDTKCIDCPLNKIANGSQQRTGEWIQKGIVGSGEYIYECSECHHTDTRSRILEVPFCWFCGARMKSKDEGLTELKYLIDEKVNYLRSRAKWEEADEFERKMRNMIARLEEEE